MRILTTTLLLLAITTATANARECKYGELPTWANKENVERLTDECISAKIHTVKTDAAMPYLVDACFNDVLNGDWTTNSKKRYKEERIKALQSQRKK